MTKIVSIIGSRETPKDVLETISAISEFFARKVWIIRTGGAKGADEAAFSGANKVKNAKIELYLPWAGYNDLYEYHVEWGQLNWDLAAQYHPTWDKLNLNSKIFHARNVGIILGRENKTPADLVVCWTPNGEETGGTAMGIKTAKKYNIKIFNLGKKNEINKLRKFCKVNIK